LNSVYFLFSIVSATLHSTWKVPIERQLVNPHARFQEMRGFDTTQALRHPER